MTIRLFVEKKPEFAAGARALERDAHQLLGINGLSAVRIFQRYDIEGFDPKYEELAKATVLSELPTDISLKKLPEGADVSFAIEYLPGQFDQRADSAAQCLQFLSQGSRPQVRSGQIYQLFGQLSEQDIERIKDYLINPVDSREVPVDSPVSSEKLNITALDDTGIIEGFINFDDAQLEKFAQANGLAMDLEDLQFCQAYFREENRDPRFTEVKVIDTYWSDHCRHTTFLTELVDVKFSDTKAQETYERYLQVREQLGRTKPITLMDLATVATKFLRSTGKLEQLDESEEINACTVKMTVDVNGEEEPWLLLFKNETHNHPTEIEPFGGAATCIGGAIRDPLSGRSYVYQAMRVTGAGDPRLPLSQTLPGKLSQRQIVREAADGYSSYGNQIGLATGLVNEIYHPGYVAKRMEIGAVVGATPEENVRREVPVAGDVVVLLGGKTGRDGCGGATGSSKTHTADSVLEAGAEVQKGNAPEERKLQRLFRKTEATKLIKRCNDFGAGGVSVAIGELADGLQIDLDKVPKKYEGLTGTELAISESQERMAVVLDPADVGDFLALAAEENLEATVVAEVTETPRLVMKHQGNNIVDLSREFLDSNGARKRASASVLPGTQAAFPFSAPSNDIDLLEAMENLVSDLNVASQRGLQEQFDSTIGSASVLMPLGGNRQLTPTQVMAAKIPVLHGETDTVSVMSYGFNPLISEKDPYRGAYLAVVESLAKLVASGASLEQTYLTFQEYFERLKDDQTRWGKPLAALLGALQAQLDFEVAAIGGKDSMSGSFESLDVPPTLVSFAITVDKASKIISPEFKAPGSKVILVSPEVDADGIPVSGSLKDIWKAVHQAVRAGHVLSAWTPTSGGVIEGLFKMSLGNKIGVELQVSPADLFTYDYGALILEVTSECNLDNEKFGKIIGLTTPEYKLGGVDLHLLETQWSSVLEPVFPVKYPKSGTDETSEDNTEFLVQNVEVPTLSYEGRQYSEIETEPNAQTGRKSPVLLGDSSPRFLIPVFPGTNCEYDTARAIEKAGGKADVFVVRNLSASDVAASSAQFAKKLSQAQTLFLPGGFSGGDEPDGSAKFIAAFMRNPVVAGQVHELLDERGGLIGGICNGFQALIKLGLVTSGRIIDPSLSDADSEEPDYFAPTLTHNVIGRHQSRLVRTRIVSNLSPWLSGCKVGEIVTVAISHGEGRFVASSESLRELAQNGQIATQYVDDNGQATMDLDFNPNGSSWAIEGLTSPDGRVFGKMGHSERVGSNLYKNVPGTHELGMFDSAVSFLRR